jgi:thioredoxin reductase (NADPH)
MFPELDPFEIERMRRFAEARSFAQGEAIFTAGQVGPGLVVILSGEVDIENTGAGACYRVVAQYGAAISS